MEGDPQGGSDQTGLPISDMQAALSALAVLGIRKVKLLGGEALVRRDIDAVIRAVRHNMPDVDLSVITAGAVPLATQDMAFEAGVNRMNVSIHGFLPDEFVRRGNKVALLTMREAFIEGLIARGLPLKLNYVYSGPESAHDLRALLDWAATRPVYVNVLDDLSSNESPATIIALLEEWFGQAHRERCPDRDSLDTLRLTWSSGLQVEIKDRHLGDLAPWSTCTSCPVRTKCREGIFAIRLTHDGDVAACMDREDLRFPLVRRLREVGQAAGTRELSCWFEDLLSGDQAPGLDAA